MQLPGWQSQVARMPLRRLQREDVLSRLILHKVSFGNDYADCCAGFGAGKIALVPMTASVVVSLVNLQFLPSVLS